MTSPAGGAEKNLPRTAEKTAAGGCKISTYWRAVLIGQGRDSSSVALRSLWRSGGEEGSGRRLWGLRGSERRGRRSSGRRAEPRLGRAPGARRTERRERYWRGAQGRSPGADARHEGMRLRSVRQRADGAQVVGAIPPKAGSTTDRRPRAILAEERFTVPAQPGRLKPEWAIARWGAT